MFEIVESDSVGKIGVATQDVLPGQLIFREQALLEAPILERDRESNGHMLLVCCGMTAFRSYNALRCDEQIRFMSLASHTRSSEAEMYRKCAALYSLHCKDDPKMKRKLNAEEIELYTKITCILQTNAFHVENCMLVFDAASRLSHACNPNVVINIVGKTCECRAILPIKCGEELVVDYNRKHRYESTAIRRYNMQLTKHFTCHCARCDAEGDDARQFDCHDSNCQGRHYAAQPTSVDEVSIDWNGNAAVTVLPSHLLPCTVCKRAAPPAYQKRVFELEKTLPSVLKKLDEEGKLIPHGHIGRSLAHLRKLRAVECPRWHALSIPLNLQRFQLFNDVRQHMPSHSEEYHWAEALGLEILRVHCDLAPYPNDDTVYWFATAMLTYGSMEQWDLSVQHGRQCVRMRLLLRGRETRRSTDDADLVFALRMREHFGGAVASETAGVHVCGLCEESPQRAALTLSRCGACKKVAYCSKGCQKAHWKVHKSICCKEK